MAIIPSNNYHKLRAFITFWEHELTLSPCARFQPTEFVYSVFDRHARNIREIGELIMAKDNSSKEKFKWKGYQNISITSDLEADVEKFVADDKNVFHSFNEMLITGYQIKVYFDEKTESMKAVATCFNADDPNFGFALSAWSMDWYTALAVLIFKHYEIADKDWDEGSVAKLNKFG